MDRLLSEQAVIDYLIANVPHDDYGDELDADELREMWTERINKIPSVEPHSIKLNQGQSSDMISRQVAIDAIEKTKTARSENNELYVGKINAQMAIMQLPSAEPQIVHCRDCKNLEIDSIFHDCWCNGHKVWLDHYCGYAERRTDG